MPLVSTKGAASAQGFGFSLQAMAAGWALTVSSATKSAIANRPLVMPDGNILVPGGVGSESNSDTNALFLVVTPAGVVSVARYFFGIQYSTIANVVVDASGNYFFGGYSQQNGASQGEALFIKINSSYALQLNKTFNYTPYANDEAPVAVNIDSSGNIYSATDIYTGGSNRSPSLIKTNSSGAITWGIQIDNVGYGRDATADSSGNVFLGVLGLVNPGNGIYSADVYSINSSGALVWQVRLMKNRFPNGNTQLEVITRDSSGNIYGAGKSESDTGNNTGFVFKLNSSGAVQWKTELAQSGIQIEFYAVCVDSSGNVYNAGRYNNYVVITKHDSSGTLQWQRILRRTTAISISARGITVDATGFIYVTGYTSVSGVLSYMVVKLKTDGTGMGTFGTFIYESNSSTSAASGTAATDPGKAVTSATFTVANAGLSTADRTGLTSALQPF